MARKKPKVSKNISIITKEPRIAFDTKQISNQKPTWQLNRIDNKGKWGWKEIGKNRWENDILPKLCNFERMTWPEIEQASGGRSSGNNSHFVNKNNLSKMARERLEELQIDDVDQVYSLRLTGKTRIIGKRIGSIMQIIWFDFNHEVIDMRNR